MSKMPSTYYVVVYDSSKSECDKTCGIIIGSVIGGAIVIAVVGAYILIAIWDCIKKRKRQIQSNTSV